MASAECSDVLAQFFDPRTECWSSMNNSSHLSALRSGEGSKFVNSYKTREEDRVQRSVETEWEESDGFEWFVFRSQLGSKRAREGGEEI